MANGPLGGFMPTPPSPGQPPQVKLETSAESRGNFNKFLGTLPKNGAIAPLQTGVMQSSTAPVSPMTSNVNIFQPQMSQMTAMPMMPPVKPVQNFFFGGAAMSGGAFSDADIGSQIDSFDDNQQSFVDDDPVAGFDFNEDTGSFDVVSAPDISDDEQQQNIQDAQTFIDTPLAPPPVVDTRPRTNIRNVGPTSNLRFDPQFTANILQQQGLDPRGFMSKDDFAQTTQGGGTGTVQTLSSGLPSLGLSQNLLGAKPTISRQDVLTAQNKLADISPASAIPLAPASPFFDRDLLDDPLGLGIRTGFGPAVDAIEEGKARGRATPRKGIQVAGGLPSIVPGAGGTLPDADPLAGDVISAIRSGAAGLPFSNNPGALKQGQEDLTTEVVKSLPASGPITTDNLAPAIFTSLDAGIGAIDRQLELYARNNINTPEALANTYLGSGNKENSPANRAGYIDAIKSVAGESFNLGNPQTRDAIKNAIVNQEFGSAGANVMADMRRGTDASVLNNLNLDQLRLNLPLTSNVNQLGTLDPIEQTQTTSQIPDVLPDISEEFFRSGTPGGNIRSGTTQVGPGGRFTFSETPGRFIGTLGGRTLSPDVYSEGSFDIGGTAPTLTSGLVGTAPIGTQRAGSRGDIVRPDASISRGMQDLTREDEQLIAPEIFGAGRIGGVTEATFRSLPTDVQQRIVSNLGDVGTQITNIDPDPNRGNFVGQGVPIDTVLDIDTTFDPITLDDRLTTISPQRQASIQQGQNIDIEDDQQTFRQTVPDAARIFGGRTIDTTPTTTTNLARGPQQSIVGDDEAFADLNLTDIEGNINQQRVADILNNPKMGETFKIGDAEFPNLIATLANKVGSFFDRRLFDGIVSKGLDAVVDPDTGRIIGAKNEFGQLIEGRDLEQFKAGDDDNQDPVTKFLKKTTEEKDEEEDEKPPNVIGGTIPTKPTPRPPTVVKSTAPASTASFTPVDFNAGNLNELIERITGVPTPRTVTGRPVPMQDGGVINAVDNFLTKVA